MEKLSDKCTDLEGRSRRDNLRILYVKEGAEAGKKPRDFVAQLLKEALSLTAPPLIDRCHRALGPRPGNDERPRPFILKMHYIRDVEEILRKAAEMQMDQLLRSKGPDISGLSPCSRETACPVQKSQRAAEG